MNGSTFHRRSRAGITLLMVLAVIAILTVLLLALFASVTGRSRFAQGSVDLAQEEMLADSAEALVVGQIEQASSQPGQTWISQPGLLRTYAATASRKPTACYKLYSTPTLDTMTDTSGTVAFLSIDVPADWSSQPDLYTDLNAPSLSSSGQSIYPILDPSAAASVPGVSIDSPHGVEMPAAWLYQLKDGTLGPASLGTPGNPIVARIAFWTDDDTSKININTAGCGSPWNTPRLNSPTDLAWSTHQPAQGEFSAYPAHPATTSLGIVLNMGTGTLSPQQLLGLTPRYAWGGSQFGAQTTTPGGSIPVKTDRLYASLDELQFGSSLTASGQRAANPITSAQINASRFVLTAHSVAPETTLLGEPRVAIWPVADSSSKTTATDRAIMSAATVGARDYYFQRNNPLNALDDFDPNSTSPAATSNLQLFGDLVNRGKLLLPGWGTTFAGKYPGAAWSQIQLEVTDFIHALNAVDPNGTPFAPNSTFTSPQLGPIQVGCGFVEPLTTSYGTGTAAIPLRGFGRCPTLSSLTIVFYVCGFGLSNGTTIAFETKPDYPKGDIWNANFGNSPTSQWGKVTSELVRAFVVPCTFQPGCAYPEVSDACQIQIQGLNSLSVTAFNASNVAKTTSLGFPASATSLPLGTPLVKYPAERAWGANEGPLAWTVTADALAQNLPVAYPFVGTVAVAIPIASGTPYTTSTWPSNRKSFTCNGANLTVVISDLSGQALQTIAVNLPAFTVPQPPTINGEADHADTIPSTPGWSGNAACAVAPSWYMTLAHRLQTSPSSRPLMIQAGDVCGSVEAAGDLRVVAGLASVPAALFKPHPLNNLFVANSQGGSQALNFRFADGTSACFAPGNVSASDSRSWSNQASFGATYATGTTTLPVYDWRTSPSTLLGPNTVTGITPYTYFTNAPCSVPTGALGVFTTSALLPGTQLNGDWDTGPGYAPDGAQINLPDAGTSLDPGTAYQSLSSGQVGAPTQRMPNALVPSPVIFGSLPAGINPADSQLTASNPTGMPQSVPWRTLLFCPYPAANTPTVNSSGTPYAIHPGAASPPDHLLLDNFWMPVVEPYAISTCMATRGKINLNDKIAPFTWLHRSTALRALLDDLRIPAIATKAAAVYKTAGKGWTNPVWNAVDEDGTVEQIENRFAAGSADAYLSESEICAVPLVPALTSPNQPIDTSSVTSAQSGLAAFWNSATGGQLTGDNLRELPYAQLYGRLTTRSNSYTIHVRVQVLKKLTRDPDQNVWKDASDLVLGEWRGSYEIERYLDPSAAAPAAGSPLGPYKFRIVSKTRFAP